MDLTAREACLRAVMIIARSARLCAELGTDSEAYLRSSESADRVLQRAERYYETMRGEHASHERQVRVVGTAVKEAATVAEAIRFRLDEPEDLLCRADTLERAIGRAGGAVTPSLLPALLPTKNP